MLIVNTDNIFLWDKSDKIMWNMIDKIFISNKASDIFHLNIYGIYRKTSSISRTKS